MKKSLVSASLFFLLIVVFGGLAGKVPQARSAEPFSYESYAPGGIQGDEIQGEIDAAGSEGGGFWLTDQCQPELVADIYPPVPDIDPLPALVAEGTITLIPPTATDNCVGRVLATTTDPLVYTTSGLYTVTWTYHDGQGNVTTQKQRVVVLPASQHQEEGREVTISDIRESNLAARSITISWRTNVSTIGQVHYGTDSQLTNYLAAFDQRAGKIHQVKLSGLKPDQTYYYEIQSGASVDNNQGRYYQFKTFPVREPGPNFFIGGRVQKDDKSPLSGAAVSVVVNQGMASSSPLTTLTNDKGVWFFNLADLKASTSGDPLWITDNDLVLIDIQTEDGCVFEDSRSISDLTQGGNYTFTPQCRVAKPVLSPAFVVFGDTVSVSLTCPTDGAEIRYTLDGSEPTGESILYTGPITLTRTATLKARGYKPQCLSSELGLGFYLKSQVTDTGLSAGSQPSGSQAVSARAPRLIFIDSTPPLIVSSGADYHYLARVNSPFEVGWQWSLQDLAGKVLTEGEAGPAFSFDLSIGAKLLKPGDFDLTLRAQAPALQAEDIQQGKIHVRAASSLEGELRCGDEGRCIFPADREILPIRIDLISKTTNRLVASSEAWLYQGMFSSGHSAVRPIEIDCASGRYRIRGLDEGAYTIVVTDIDSSDDSLREDAEHFGKFEPLRQSIQLAEGMNTQHLNLTRPTKDQCLITGSVEAGAGWIELFLSGEDSSQHSLSRRITLPASGPFTFFVPRRGYTLTAQAAGYQSAVMTIASSDDGGGGSWLNLGRIVLAEQASPSVFLVRQDEHDPTEGHRLILNFQYHGPDGRAEDWSSRYLRLVLFSREDDQDQNGLPDHPDSPSGARLYPVVVEPARVKDPVFGTQYLRVQIPLGNLDDPASARHIMTKITESGTNQIIAYQVGVRGEVVEDTGGGSLPKVVATFSRLFRVDRRQQEKLIGQSVAELDLRALLTQAEIPVVMTMALDTQHSSSRQEVSGGAQEDESGQREVQVKTSFNVANIDPAFLARVDEQGRREERVDPNQRLELTIDCRQSFDDPDRLIVDIHFTDQEGRRVEYNPPDPQAGFLRSPEAEPIIIFVPLHKALQRKIQEPGVVLADIEALVAKDEDDFELAANGQWQPKPGLYGIYFEGVGGQRELFRPNPEQGEGIAITASEEGVLLARVQATHTSRWFTDRFLLAGDLNADGVITPGDAISAFRCYLELGPCPAHADVNHDGTVTPGDAICIFRKYLELPSCLD